MDSIKVLRDTLQTFWAGEIGVGGDISLLLVWGSEEVARRWIRLPIGSANQGSPAKKWTTKPGREHLWVKVLS